MPDRETTSGAPRRRRKVTPYWLDAIVIVFIIFLVLLVLPNYMPRHGGSPEAQVKSNLHNIQLAIERYAVDHDGQYPLYLIGGQGKYSRYVEGSGGNAFVNVADCADRSLLSDPLLREGYMEAYPENPFTSVGRAVHLCQIDHADPLLNGTDAAKMHGTRFGPYCTLSGNVLGDRRHPDFTVFTSDGASTAYPTYADVDYHCYDIWETDKPHPFMPGEIFYRSSPLKVGEPVPASGELQDGVAHSYMLGGYGAIRTKGRDVLGPDPFGVNDASPFSVGDDGRLAYGNPNGIRDAIILVLTSGLYDEWQLPSGN